MKLNMNKINKKIAGGILILLLLIIGVSGYFSLRGFSKTEKVISDAAGVDNNGVKSYEYLTKDGYRRVICKKDLINPVNVTITDSKNRSGGIFAFYTNLTRDNIFSDFKTNDYQGGTGSTKFTETNLDKVANWYEQKGCDYFKQSGSIENTSFSYNPPLTPEKIREAEKQQKSQQTQDQITQKIQSEGRKYPTPDEYEATTRATGQFTDDQIKQYKETYTQCSLKEGCLEKLFSGASAN
jgi:uncharacterized protein (UPF0333 family)